MALIAGIGNGVPGNPSGPEAPERATLRAAFLAQIRALASDGADLRELAMIAQIAAAAGGALKILSLPLPPNGSVAAQVGSGPQGAYLMNDYYSSSDSTINVGPAVLSGYNNGGGMNSETFGATVIRESMAMLGAFLKRREEDDAKSKATPVDDADGLCAAISAARKAGLEDVAKKLEHKLMQRYLDDADEAATAAPVAPGALPESNTSTVGVRPEDYPGIVVQTSAPNGAGAAS